MTRKLEVFRQKWKDCTACSLGVQREAQGHQTVMGEGSQGGILFINDTVTWQEEKHGVHLAHKDHGVFFRGLLTRLNFKQTYITGVVLCRSCVPYIDPETGRQKIMNAPGRLPMLGWSDRQPSKPHVDACRERLHEEIYAVDPCIIVTLGQQASEALIQKPINIQQKHGKALTIDIPGRGVVPSLTDKRKMWGRTSNKVTTWPVEQNMVRYVVVPIFHPSQVLSEMHGAAQTWKTDKKHILNVFLEDLRMIKSIFMKYQQEVYQTTPPEEDLVEIEPVTEGQAEYYEQHFLD